MKPDEIKVLRKEKKLTQDELGELCGVRNSSVSRWEKGVDSPSGPALKILQQLRDGDLVVSEVSDLEVKLLDQNVAVGKFKSREDYLTVSLKHLLLHGEFMSIKEENTPNITALPEKVHTMAAAGSAIMAEVLDFNEGGTVFNVKVIGDSMEPLLKDGHVASMAPRSLSRSPYMKKGLIYFVRTSEGQMIKRYDTRNPKGDEKGAEFLTKDGMVGILKSENKAYEDIAITGPDQFEWEAWADKNGNYPKIL